MEAPVWRHRSLFLLKTREPHVCTVRLSITARQPAGQKVNIDAVSIAPQSLQSQASIDAKLHPTPQPQRGTVNRRDFANTLDASLMILRAIGFPLKRRQNVVSALQGKAGGRIAFQLSHLTLARSMQHQGSDDAARAYVRRELDALEHFQRRTGYRLFNVNRGGGADHERTAYEDFLTPASLWAVERARADREAWAANPGKTLGSFVAEAVGRLPRFEPERFEPNAPSEPPPVRVARHRQHTIKRACAAMEVIREEGGDVVSFATSLAREIMERAHLIAGAEMDADLAAESRAAADAEMSHRSLPPRHFTDQAEPFVEFETEPGEELDGGAGGLQICHPSGEKAQEIEPLLPGMVDVALAYAACGWRVFPLHTPDAKGRCSCAKAEECRSAGKHPRTVRGVNEATTDAEQIARWWARWQDANIGIATGAGSGLVVLDIDPRHGGDVSLAELMERHGDLPQTLESATGGGGWHVLFKHPGIAFKNSASVLGEGLDVKTDGGYIVASPSLHASGRRYEWRDDDARPAEMPSWLVELLTAPVRREQPGGGARTVARSDARALDTIIAEGSRNDALFRRVACRLRGAGAGYGEIVTACLEANARLCSPPLPEDEVLKLAASATRYTAGVKG